MTERPRAPAPAVDALRLPALYCPFPYMIHPGVDQAEEHTIAWLDQFELYASRQQRDRIAGCGCGRAAALLCPRCPSQERLDIYADFYTWAFAFDDDFCDEGAMRLRPAEQAEAFGRMQRAAEAPEWDYRATDNPLTDRYALALRDLRVRIDTCTSSAQGDSFAAWMRGYFMIELWKSGVTARGLYPDLNDYVIARLFGGGGMVFNRVTAVLEGIELPAEVAARGDVRALIELGGLITCCGGDLFAFVKEHERTGDGYNIVEVVAREHGLPFHDAAVEAVKMHDRMVSLFMRLGRHLGEEHPDLRRYAACLGQYIRGDLDWSHEAATTHRYTRSDGSASVVLPGWSDVPSDDSADPLPIPSIAWWWQYDPAAR